MEALILLLALAGCGGLYDPADCRQGGEDCEVYRPEGLLCGMVERKLYLGRQGSLCNGLDPSDETESDRCPVVGDDRPIYQRGTINEHEGTLTWEFCQGVDNASSSSGDLAEVPPGAACGLNSTHRTDTTHDCLGVNPLRTGRCPDGFTLRYSIDVFHDCPESQPPLPDPLQCERPAELSETFTTGCDGDGVVSYGHLVVWCERDADPDAAQSYTDDFLCGLTGTRENDPYDSLFWRRLHWESLTTEICQTMLTEWREERDQSSRCLGVETRYGCPEGMARVCVPDAHGSSLGAYWNEEALCWCTTGERISTSTD